MSADDAETITASALQWVSVGAGRLALTHRPRSRALPLFRAQGCVRLVTLLSAREGAEHIGELARAAGLAWTWLPLENARPPTDPAVWLRIEQGLAALVADLDAGASLALHCSAGIHRTGMIAYALLRARGGSPEQALAAIERMRPVTRAGMAAERQRFGDAIAAQLAP